MRQPFLFLLCSSAATLALSLYLYTSFTSATSCNDKTHHHLDHEHSHIHAPNTDFCGFDAIQSTITSQDQQVQNQLEQQLYAMLQKGYPTTNGKALYTVPVVVHVVHNNGPGNIPTTQATAAIQHLNDAFANVGVFNPATGVDVEVQFCLAQRDPNGNTTNGITNTVSTLANMNMNTQDLALKNLIRWNPLDYVNIWVVNNIAGGVAGYAYFPSSHGNNNDGIVLESNYMGTNTDNSKVLVHEMGHYLGLYHTFQGGCSNNDCLTDGDRVCDTPPDNTTAWVPCTAATNSCQTDEDDLNANNPYRPVANGGLGDQQDQKENYMDYSDLVCYDRFSQGQKIRTHFFLTGIRASLLNSQGCVPACTNPVNISFNASATAVTTGTNVTFTNTTTGATVNEWFVDGVSFANTNNSNYLFNIAGTYVVLLQSGNGDPNCTVTDSVLITVTCAAAAAFSVNNFFPNGGDIVTATNNSTGATGYEWTLNGSTYSTSTNLSLTFTAAGNYELCLYAYNAQCTTVTCQTVYVTVDTSDCGNTFFATIGATGDDEYGQVLEAAPGGVFFLGGGKADSALLVQVDATGTPIWQRTFRFTTFPDEIITDLKIDSDTNLIAVGYSRSGNNRQSFAFKYNYLTHTMVWSRRFTGPSTSPFLNINEKAANDNYLITGQTANNGAPGLGCDGLLMEVNRATGATIQMHHYNMGSCETFTKTIVHNGELYITGRYNNAGGGTNRMRAGVTRMDFSGNQTWSRLYITNVNTNARLYGQDLLVDNDSLVMIDNGDENGTSATAVEMHIYKTDLNGQIAWAKRYDIPNGDAERARRMINLPDGYLILGYYTPSGGSSTDIFLMKVDKAGTLLWSKVYGTTVNERGNDILLYGNSIFFIGDTESFGGGGDNDILFSKLDLDGNVKDTCSFIQNLTIIESDVNNPYDGSHPLTRYARADGFVTNNVAANNTTLQTSFHCSAPCSEICNNGIDDDGDGLVDCFDPDCCASCQGHYYNECPPVSCSYNETDTSLAIYEKWRSPGNMTNFILPVVGDLDGDGIPEVLSAGWWNSIYADSTPLYILDGQNGNIKQTIILPAGYAPETAPVIADVDHDGTGEIFIYLRGNRRLYRYEHDGTLTASVQLIPVFQLVAGGVNVADFDQNGTPEIYALGKIFDANLNLLASLSSPAGIGLGVAVDVLADTACTHCRGLELVLANTVYSVDLLGGTLNVESQALSSNVLMPDGTASIVDFDKDGDLDAVVSTFDLINNEKRLYLWDLQTSTVLNTYTATDNPSVNNVSDIDNDGRPEVIFKTLTELIALDDDFSTVLWQIPIQENGANMTPCTVFDFNADGSTEIIDRDKNFLRIIDGQTGFVHDAILCRSGTGWEYPVIADVDADGQAEIIVSGSVTPTGPFGDNGHIRVFASSSTPWAPTRKVWNQTSFFNVNINDNLTIPIQQQAHHIVGDSVYLNNFLTGYSDAQFPAPDATVSINTIQCAPDSVTLNVTICNYGENTLPLQTPMAIYNSDPTNTAATLLAPIYTIGQNIEIDSCITLTVKASNASASFYIVINDDASVPSIYNLSTDFPVTSIPECDFLNNIDSIALNYNTPSLDLGADTTLCENGVLSLNAGSGFYSYLWQNGHIDSFITTDAAGLYWVEVTDICGNAMRDSIVISYDTIGLLTLTDTVICIGDTIHLAFDVTNIYQWFANQNISCTNCPTPSFFPTSTRTYTGVVNNSIGCFSVDSFTITVDPCSNPIYTMLDTNVCLRTVFNYLGNNLPVSSLDTFQLTASTGLDSFVIVHVMGLDTFNTTIDTLICMGDSLIWAGQTLYTNTSTIFNFQTVDGCDSTLTVNVIGVGPFNTIVNTPICMGDSLPYSGQILYPNTSTIFNFQTVNGCDSTVVVNTIAVDTFYNTIDTSIAVGTVFLFGGQALQPNTSTIFNFQTVDGCDSTILVNVGADVASVLVGLPNAFTPNNDGVNDRFYPIGLNESDIIRFRVFNRWGQEVYNGDDQINGGWDGTYRGVDQPTEVYLFLLEYDLGDASGVRYLKGDVTLIR